MSSFKVFYSAYATDEHVESADARDMTATEIVTTVLPKMKTDQDFFGLLDANGNCLQFACNGDSVLADMPQPKRRGSYSRAFAMSELAAVVLAVPADLESMNLEGYSFQSWG